MLDAFGQCAPHFWVKGKEGYDDKVEILYREFKAARLAKGWKSEEAMLVPAPLHGLPSIPGKVGWLLASSGQRRFATMAWPADA